MPDPSDGMRELAKRLLDKTEEGSVKWEKDEDASVESFDALLGSLTASIYARDNDGNHPYVLTLYKTKIDPDGDTSWMEVESINSHSESQPVTNVLASLWKEARGSALNINASIQDALKALSED
jgi:hypothetical protein